jgi:hypothetical protein
MTGKERGEGKGEEKKEGKTFRKEREIIEIRRK